MPARGTRTRAAAGEPMKGITAPNPLRRHRRTVAAFIAIVSVALLVAACSGSGSAAGSGGSNAGESTTSPSAVAYSACMRSHGVPNFPDPDSNGQLPKETAQQLGVSPSQFNAAQRACQHLLPNTGSTGSFDQQEQQCYTAGNCPPALVQQMLTVGRKFARCMRNHGVSNWPDPTLDSQGRPFFNLSGHGITRSEWHSSQMRAKAQECGRVAGGGLATG
jgi:hypothetical protein